jgi:uncharacterized protein YwqG
METECQLASNGIFCGGAEGFESRRAAKLRAGAPDWRQVMQHASDDRTRRMWADVGRHYVWMREQDIQKGRFDRCWTVLQCY